MTGAQKRFLVVSHEASLTGAPRVAIEVARALAHEGECEVVLRWDGPLKPEFLASGARVHLEPLRRLRVLLRQYRATRRAAIRLETGVASWVLRVRRPDVVYVNTVKSACYVRPALHLGISVVLHCHELEPLASSTLARYDLASFYDRVRMVACSEAARDNLAAIAGADPSTISVIPSVPDETRVLEQGRIARAAGLDPPSARVIGACGTADARKGVDLWLEVASSVVAGAGGLDLQFIWVGEADQPAMERRIAALGLTGHVRFCGPTDNPFAIMAGFDVFTLPSRTDAFPLVVIEAMVLGLPVVAFDVGGVREQLDTAGVIVQPFDTAGMAVAILDLLRDESRRSEMARRAKDRARSHYSIAAFRSSVAAVAVGSIPPCHQG